MSARYGLPRASTEEYSWQAFAPPLSVNIVLSAEPVSGPASAEVWVFDPHRAEPDFVRRFAFAGGCSESEIERGLHDIHAWVAAAPGIARPPHAAHAAPHSAHGPHCSCNSRDSAGDDGGWVDRGGSEREVGVDIRIALEDVLDAAMSASSAAMGDVQIFDQLRGELRLVAWRGLPMEFARSLRVVRPGIDTTVCARAFSSRREEFVADVMDDAEFQPYWDIARSVGFRAVHSVPLMADGWVAGVVSCLYARSLHVAEAAVSQRVAHASRRHYAALAARAW